MSLLFLAHRVPFPPDRGDKIRSFHILQYLAQRTPVHLVAFADDEADVDPPAVFTDMLASCTIIPRAKSQTRAAIEALATGKPVSLTAFAHPAVQAAVDRVVPQVGGVYCFSGQMAQYLPAGGPPIVMDFVDIDSAKFGGFAEDARGPMRWMMRREARLLGAFEREIASRVSASLFVSEAEAALFRDGDARGRVLAVENGIDAVKFDPALNAAISRSSAEGLIVFTGQMDYRPNIDAVTWFARDILPLICRYRPVQFAIVGRAPTPAVQALASDHVTVTGAVDDVRGWLAAADVCVAPLKLARGVQNKVLEAMAMARPVVASAAAAEGIDHAGTIRVAETAAGFAAEVIALLEAPEDAAGLGESARAQVIRRYGWDARLAPLDALLGLSA
ncbi:sugar transferase (PEP-CTERM/EpsH1 system associated) [Sphingomonas sp. PP-CE-3G-477]|uniref:TIGR03087 family PEP-CTERM/XrtA system glycosyltransferase n=1 Tax=Sphingomonas sp. PP-CE-3G-477 TaxID=2135660 RepID=UPI000D38B42F|nr:TIGR03087 family PEP-CTERM/XrtA system glycosyltransferase [Sphingomonas sp. PP-CE-3G-477]PTQ65964.1 sugar transferase (PEP-CTERM/EpsH1 system associated) [Sphingomonas sp. PP-CE-3G-477]